VTLNLNEFYSHRLQNHTFSSSAAPKWVPPPRTTAVQTSSTCRSNNTWTSIFRCLKSFCIFYYICMFWFPDFFLVNTNKTKRFFNLFKIKFQKRKNQNSF
jgi:hypothetical protein